MDVCTICGRPSSWTRPGSGKGASRSLGPLVRCGACGLHVCEDCWREAACCFRDCSPDPQVGWAPPGWEDVTPPGSPPGWRQWRVLEEQELGS